MDRSGRKNIVVIGNGFGGSQVTAGLVAAAKKANKDIAITVLTPIDYHEIQICMTKVIATGPEEHSTALFPLLKEDNVNYVIGACQQLNETSLLTSTGQTINFDICVVATGLNYGVFQAGPEHPSVDGRKQFIKGLNAQIAKANSIVVSGGGPIGTEIASDIKIRNPNKQVILVCSGILPSVGESFRVLAERALRDQGVEIILNDHVLTFANGKVTTQSGKSIDADLYIPGHSAGPNTTFAPPSLLDTNKYIKVTECLNAEGNPKVFAIGDCSSYDPVKIVPKVGDQVPTVVKNVLAMVDNRPLTPHKKGFMGNLTGPLLIAFGHGHERGYGVGPMLPGCLGVCCWVCCCVGPPCSPPAGKQAAKIKSDFNKSVVPKPGKGISA